MVRCEFFRRLITNMQNVFMSVDPDTIMAAADCNVHVNIPIQGFHILFQLLELKFLECVNQQL